MPATWTPTLSRPGRQPSEPERERGGRVVRSAGAGPVPRPGRKMGPARRAGQQRRRGRSHQPAGGHHAGRMAPDAGRQPDRHLPVRGAVPLLRAAGGGAIINISSVAGRLGFSLRTPYSASKFGLAGLTQTWAMELGPSNIRVNSVLPGVVAGERVERVIAARRRRRRQQRRDARAAGVQRVAAPHDAARGRGQPGRLPVLGRRRDDQRPEHLGLRQRGATWSTC